MIIRYEHHRTPWGPEVYAIVDDFYDVYDDGRQMAGVGSTEEEALEDLKVGLERINVYL